MHSSIFIWEIFVTGNSLNPVWQRHIQNPVENLRWRVFAKIVNGFRRLTIYPKKLFSWRVFSRFKRSSLQIALSLSTCFRTSFSLEPLLSVLVSALPFLQSLFLITIFPEANYKTRNTGTGNGTWRIREMLYSRECRQTFRGMSPNILRNIPEHSVECHQTFREMCPNIPGNVPKHSGKRR